MDKISILNLKIPAFHGVYEFEKKKEGTFELDIEMFLDLGRACCTDQLEDTIDYAEATDVIIKAFTEKKHSLIESIGEKICQRLLNEFPIEKVMIKIRKPHAPIKANFETVEVQITRERNIDG